MKKKENIYGSLWGENISKKCYSLGIGNRNFKAQL